MLFISLFDLIKELTNNNLYLIKSLSPNLPLVGDNYIFHQKNIIVECYHLKSTLSQLTLPASFS
jgi:hypothetical protein